MSVHKLKISTILMKVKGYSCHQKIKFRVVQIIKSWNMKRESKPKMAPNSRFFRRYEDNGDDKLSFFYSYYFDGDHKV